MKRLRRIIFNALTVLSLLLCIGTATVWVRSYITSDDVITANAAGRLLWLSASHGYVRVQAVSGWPNPEPLRWFREGEGDGKRPCIHFSAQSLNQRPPWLRWQRFGLSARYGPALTRRSLNGTAMWETEDPNDASSLPEMAPAPVSFVVVFLPFWNFLILGLLLPVLWVILHLTPIITRARRMKRGACEKCGYDLRATPDRCPECGKVPEQKS